MRALPGQTPDDDFEGFTEDDADAVIGVGAAAISEMGDVIEPNEKHLGRYQETTAAVLAGSRGVALQPLDRARNGVIERRLCNGAVDPGAAHRLFGGHARLDRTAYDRFAGLVLHGIATITGATLALTQDGLPYARPVARAFDPQSGAERPRFSRAV